MCYDDFDFDDYDDMDDPGDDFSEDILEDEFEPEMDELDAESGIEEPVAPESPFDLQDAFILGGMMEDNLQRTMTLYDGSLSFLWERPVSLGITVLLVLVILTPVVRTIRDSRRQS